METKIKVHQCKPPDLFPHETRDAALNFREKKSLIDDNANPYDVSKYCEEDLLRESMRSLYSRTCEEFGVGSNVLVSSQLPATVSHHPYYKIHVLDLSNTYLGSKSCAALVPVVNACVNLLYLLMVAVGLDNRACIPLAITLKDHPALRTLDLSDNNLGTKCGSLLLDLVRTNTRIRELRLDRCLIIDPIMKKINKQIEANRALPEQCELAIDESENDIASEDERPESQRKKHTIETSVHVQASCENVTDVYTPGSRISLPLCIALSEFCLLLWRFRHRVEAFVDLCLRFSRPSKDPVSDGRPEIPKIQNRAMLLRHVPSEKFSVSMNALGVPSLGQDCERCIALARMFYVYNETSDSIDVFMLLQQLRQHTSFLLRESPLKGQNNSNIDNKKSAAINELESKVYSLYQLMADALYDKRCNLIDCCRFIDIDQTGFVHFHELVAGAAPIINAVLLGGKSTENLLEKVAEATCEGTLKGSNSELQVAPCMKAEKSGVRPVLEHFLKKLLSSSSILDSEGSILRVKYKYIFPVENEKDCPLFLLHQNIDNYVLQYGVINLTDDASRNYRKNSCKPEIWAHRHNIADLL